MNPPYYACFFQGDGFIVNAKVDCIPEAQSPDVAFVELIWIKYNNFEWEVDLKKQSIKYSPSDAKSFFKQYNFACNNEPHKKYDFNFSNFAKIKFMSFNRTTDFVFGIDFFKKYGDFQNCYGALISKKHLRYLSHLKEIIS